jgi:hypothetical protein
VGGWTSQFKKERSSMRGCHLEMSQLISFVDVFWAHGCRHRRTTTVSDLAGIKPSMKTFLVPQL